MIISRVVDTSPRLTPLFLMALLALVCLTTATPSSALAANTPPKVHIVQPADGATFVSPGEIEILAEAADADGFVKTVELFTELGSLGSVSPNPAAASPVNPFRWVWRNPGAGEHKLAAQVTDNEGATTFSDSVMIIVRGDGASEVSRLSIVKPAQGEVFGPGTLVNIHAVAVDPIGDIRHVEFFANDHSIGRSDHWTKDAVIPGRPREHLLEWKPETVGRYLIVAKATDTRGALVVSEPVSIIIGADLPIVSIYPTVPETSEPEPNIRVRQGVFTLKRSGDASK
jgi:hypothetical protein